MKGDDKNMRVVMDKSKKDKITTLFEILKLAEGDCGILMIKRMKKDKPPVYFALRLKECNFNLGNLELSEKYKDAFFAKLVAMAKDVYAFEFVSSPASYKAYNVSDEKPKRKK